MPYQYYECANEHYTEMFFKTFKDAEEAPTVSCSTCNSEAIKVIAIPGMKSAMRPVVKGPGSWDAEKNER